LHISQSPLSRAIRELERDLGVVLFVRTTRRVELTDAGMVLLERSRRALAEIDGAIAGVRRSAGADGSLIRIAYGPFSGAVARLVLDAVGAELPKLRVRLEEEISSESLRRVGAHELSAAIVLESPAAARRYGVRVDALRDEPLLAALPNSHRFAGAGAIPVGAFAEELVLLPREPQGSAFNAWLRTVIGAHGSELGRTMKTLSAPWDRRMLPVARGEAVSVVVAEWVREPTMEFTAVPFDPPLNFPIDLASCWPATQEVDLMVRAALRMREVEGWLTRRTARTELPED
jgi:DNA-binding transcriptional LysR family regulator